MIESFSRDSNYDLDFMLWIKGQVLKSWQVQLFKHYYSNILNVLMILICLYIKIMLMKCKHLQQDTFLILICGRIAKIQNKYLSCTVKLENIFFLITGTQWMAQIMD